MYCFANRVVIELVSVVRRFLYETELTLVESNVTIVLVVVLVVRELWSGVCSDTIVSHSFLHAFSAV